MSRVVEGIVGRVKKRQAQELSKTTLYCADFQEELMRYFLEWGDMGWERDERQEMSQLGQKGSKDHGITAFCVGVEIH